MLVVKTYTIMPAATAMAMSNSVAMIGEIALAEVNRMFQSGVGDYITRVNKFFGSRTQISNSRGYLAAHSG